MEFIIFIIWYTGFVYNFEKIRKKVNEYFFHGSCDEIGEIGSSVIFTLFWGVMWPCFIFKDIVDKNKKEKEEQQNQYSYLDNKLQTAYDKIDRLESQINNLKTDKKEEKCQKK